MNRNLPHTLPLDVQRGFAANTSTWAAWQRITPLAKNEFICWITSAKKPETKARRLRIAIDKLNRGERRPCCWSGCTHRTT
ncbi:MAG: YdeI/OmpD-associated family protein [Candidatus Saccharimonas sp.]